ncbi:MAG: F0F1 ATP synthase subunit A [Bacteroidales bacterium]|nr:F0F1 ATP synthase subunit A [Bacteroidales bacterium]
MKKLVLGLLFATILLGTTSLRAQDSTDFDPGAMIIGHVTDAHSWHLFDYMSSDGSEHAVAVPLPVILINEGHVDVFMSSKFKHGHADYRGYRLIGGGSKREEVVCVTPEGELVLDENGAVVKPVDLSITKTSAAIMVSVILLIVIIFIAKAGYKKRPNQAPRGIQSLVEMLVVFVRDTIVRPTIGEAHYQRYLPYLLTLFFFIFFSNILGLIPIFPAGANITGNIAVTAILAIITFFITNISGNKHYWKDIFNTPGVPAWLKIFPLMPLVEFIGIFTKPIVLMIRLFANMTAGHIVVLGFVVIIFILSNLFGNLVGGAVSVFSVAFMVFIDVLECLVAYIQAFVFTMLTATYIGMAVSEPEHVNAK